MPNATGWLNCEVVSAEFTDRGILLNIVTDKYSFTAYKDRIKRSDIRWK